MVSSRTVTGRTLWSDQLDGDERRVLDPGPEAPEPRPDVLVVGGGMLGVAIALACQRASLGSVVLIEAGRLGAGATGGAAGLIMPEAHFGSDPPHFVELGRASLELWRELEASTPGGIGYRDMDWLGLAPLPEAFLADPPPGVEWLSEDDMAARVPGLAQKTSGASVRHQGRVNPLRAVGRLAAQLPQVSTSVAATAVEVSHGRLVGVSTTAGPISPGVVVFATGNPPDLTGLPLDIPANLVKGHLAVTEPVSLKVPGSVAPLATQVDDGRLLMGGTVDTDDVSTDLSPKAIEGLRNQLVTAFPELARARFTHEWCCWRPHHPDSQPVVDRIPGVDNAWLTSGHYRTGILMAPVTATLIVEWVTSGEQPARARPWGTSGRWA
jgi:glycine/D-amino acid oxidase-like deaminating enzyme